MKEWPRTASNSAPRRRVVASWTIVAAVFGLMVSVQYHDVTLGGAAIWSALPDVASVSSRLAAVDNVNQSLMKREAGIMRRVLVLQADAIRRGGVTALVERQLHAARVLAGTVALTGPGVVVTISDGHMSGPDMARFITHDWDLRSVVNELFVAGADAVSINSARISAQTGVYCIGPVVRVGNVRLGPPFVIRAIGDSSVLAAALNLPGGVLDALRGVNRGLDVTHPEQKRRIRIPAYEPALLAQTGEAQQ